MTFSIRRCKPTDTSDIARMMGDDAVYPGLLQTPYPSEERWRKIIEGNDAPGNSDLMLVAVSNDQVVASAGLHGAGPQIRRRHVVGLGISVAQSAQGQGIGAALMAALTDYADNWGHVLRIELTVYTDNLRAIKLYQRFGFEEEGVRRAYALRDGVFVDALGMARLHPKPPQLPAPLPATVCAYAATQAPTTAQAPSPANW
jgi:putative acetyltransferase